MIQAAYKGLKDVVAALKSQGVELVPASTPLTELPSSGARFTYSWSWEPLGGGGLHLKGAHVFNIAVTSRAPNREEAIEAAYESLAKAVASSFGQRARLTVLGLEGDEEVLTLNCQLRVVGLERGGVL